MSQKPRNPKVSAAAVQIVEHNLANLPEPLKAFVTPSQIAKSQAAVQAKIDAGEVHRTATYSAPKVVQHTRRGAYPEPAHVSNSTRIFADASRDAHVKARSRRGWTTQPAKA